MDLAQVHIAETFTRLMEENSYHDISIRMICLRTPISRTTFYRYFADKQQLTEWVVRNDYEHNALVVFQHHLGLSGTQAFFSHILKKKKFYISLFKADNGHLLGKCLRDAYKIYFDRLDIYALQKENHLKKIPLEVVSSYSTSGITSVVIDWVRNGMKTPVEEMGRELGMLIESPLSYIRDNYLD